eukprot:scaffold2636_cov340-Pavlova_lutheri.AAC.124
MGESMVACAEGNGNFASIFYCMLTKIGRKNTENVLYECAKFSARGRTEDSTSTIQLSREC